MAGHTCCRSCGRMTLMDQSAPTQSDDALIQPICAIFRRFLKRKGLKFTTERALILNTVLAKDEVFEADQLLQDMRTGKHRVSKATIYRTLKHLVEAKLVTEVLIEPERAHYELSFGRKPQGHLVCVETGRIIEIPSPWLEPVRDRICKEHDFEPVSHQFVIYGISLEAREGDESSAT